jgi:hypothetical protein
VHRNEIFFLHPGPGVLRILAQSYPMLDDRHIILMATELARCFYLPRKSFIRTVFSQMAKVCSTLFSLTSGLPDTVNSDTTLDQTINADWNSTGRSTS